MSITTIGAIGRQLSAGVIVGLSAVIYSLSYGALLFAGPLSAFVGFGISVALITAIVGALFGLLSEEKTFISGPDSNTISVLASMLAVLGSLDLPGSGALDVAVTTVFMTSILSAVAFYAVARANLSSLVRYIPFPVMAGFLASTGWLMASGALNIISGTPLSRVGLEKLLADPNRPELGFGLLVVGCLFALASRISSAVLIPLVMAIATLTVNVVLAGGLCTAHSCRAETWLFPKMGPLQWLPPWKLDWHFSDLDHFVQDLPGMLVVCFVGLLTILLSVASLELSFQKEFSLNKLLKAHALSAVLSALFGGFVGIISIGRTTLNQQVGGGAAAGAIASSICLATLLGGGAIIAYIPKAALGGLVLYLGLDMMRQWLWNQRRTVTSLEFGQIVLILTLVANYGFLAGFSAGLLFSCVLFIVSFSRVPLADLATNLSLFTSSVVRSEYEAECLRQHGDKTRLYRLSGYVFFGSASKIDVVFQTMRTAGNNAIEGAVIDFTNVSGIDSSAISVFQRILRRYRDKPTRFYFVYSNNNEASLRSISLNAEDEDRIHYFRSLDHAIETAEQNIIAKWGREGVQALCFDFLENPAAREIFLNHCELRHVQNGERLCTEGERSDALFFVESGSLEVVRSADGASDLRLAKLHKGAMVGELAFYTGEARTASISAAVDSTVYILRKDALSRLRATHPELATSFDHMVIQKISRDLTRTNKLVAMFR